MHSALVSLPDLTDAFIARSDKRSLVRNYRAIGAFVKPLATRCEMQLDKAMDLVLPKHPATVEIESLVRYAGIRAAKETLR